MWAVISKSESVLGHSGYWGHKRRGSRVLLDSARKSSIRDLVRWTDAVVFFSFLVLEERTIQAQRSLFSW